MAALHRLPSPGRAQLDGKPAEPEEAPAPSGGDRGRRVLPAGIHQIHLPLAGTRLGHVNGYLLAGDDGYTLVDCGWNTPDVLKALQHALSELGVRIADIRTLVVTHYHSDHYGLAGTLLRLGDMRLLMHRLDWLYVRTHLSDPAAAAEGSTRWLTQHGLPAPDYTDEERRTLQSAPRFEIVPPHRELAADDWLGVSPHDLRVIWTPGHTEGHICLYDPRRRLLFSGDHVLDPITPNVSITRPGARNPLGAYLASLRRVAELDVDLVLPAHGEPFGGLQRRVRELLAHHAERESATREALQSGPATGGAVAACLPWTRRGLAFGDLAAFQQRLALGEALAHLELLCAEGLATSTARNGRVYFEPVVAERGTADA